MLALNKDIHIFPVRLPKGFVLFLSAFLLSLFSFPIAHIHQKKKNAFLNISFASGCLRVVLFALHEDSLEALHTCCC